MLTEVAPSGVASLTALTASFLRDPAESASIPVDTEDYTQCGLLRRIKLPAIAAGIGPVSWVLSGHSDRLKSNPARRQQQKNTKRTQAPNRINNILRGNPTEPKPHPHPAPESITIEVSYETPQLHHLPGARPCAGPRHAQGHRVHR